MDTLQSSALFSQRKWLVLSILTIAIVGSIVYHPAIGIGFWTDDYAFLETAGRLSLADYLVSYFDPRLQWHWYRPMQGIQWWIGYNLFGTEPAGYHLLQILLHLANALLLFGLVARVSRRWRIGLIAALSYVTLQIDSLAVFWPAVADPLAALFYLLAILFWIDYIEIGGGFRYALAFAALVFALLSKESAITLPVVLFLVDRWLIKKPASLAVLIKRYAGIFFSVMFFGLLELNVLSRGVFTQQLGYGVGAHIVSALFSHLALLVFPWGSESPLRYVWLSAMLVFFVYAAISRERRLFFIGAAMLVSLLPVLPFPAAIALAPRYLYLPLMGSAVGIGLLIEGAILATKFQWRWVPGIFSLIPVLLIIWGSAGIAEGAVAFAGTVREARLQFRPIFLKHPTFASGTLLYFLDPPYPNLSGLMFSRYGANVLVDTTESDHLARLRDRATALVFYLDDNKVWHEQAVAKNSTVHIAPDLPALFSESISLQAFEVVSASVKRGEAVVLILYWRTDKKINKDYTVFVHLIDAKGQRVGGVDSQPQSGRRATSSWSPDQLVPDGIVIPIDTNVAPGNYKIELGLYDASTLQRLSTLDARGQPVNDKIVIEPIQVVE